MIIDNNIKKHIAEDWLKAFPQLSAFAQNKFYKVAGCLIAGIELIKLPNSEEYRPHFVIYDLWSADVKKCLDSPLVMKQLYNKKGLQFNIPYLGQAIYFDDAVKDFKKQFPFVECDIRVRSLFEFIESLFNDRILKANTLEQVKLFELKFYVLLFTDNKDELHNILNQIEKKRSDWNMQIFEVRYGKFEIWYEGLKSKIGNQKAFFEQIEINKQDKKIKQLKISNLIA